MFIYVFEEQEKDKLILNGYKFICKNQIGDKNAYVFENNNKLNFAKENIKAYKTSKLYF